ncbi:TolC family protein [Cellulophaga sp. Hel_I_12]|uniref:TolC family protein n=1 Tax=Cellulophaga sp. Hel_I_12 TaxID=1249972 RepID=UPI0006476897|nr:TolC family protein [Cellulophaga sp. Hel_I_12]
MKFKIVLIAFLFSVAFISAQTKKWTLQECVAYAVDNNLTIEQFELDLETVKIEKSDAIGDFLPGLNASSSVAGQTGLSFDPTTNQAVTTTIFTATGGLSSNVTLFDGLRNVHRLNRAKMNAISSQYRLDDLKDDIRLNVAVAYLNVLSNKESLRVFQAQYSFTKQDLIRTEELVDAGVVPRGDLLELEATAANQEQQIVNSENAILIARINLAQLLQITDYENFDIVDESFDIPPSEVLTNSPKTIYEKALTFRNDIKFSELNVELAKKDLQISKGALLPTIGAFFNYNTRYSSQERFDVTTQEFFRESFKDQLWINDGISYGAQLSIPIFNGFGVKNNIKRSKINIDRANIQLEQEKLALETTVNQAYVDVKNLSKAYEAAGKTVAARRLAYEYSKERFDVGLMNSFDFSQAQARVDDAEAQLIRTKYDYIFRLKVLEFYFGMPISLD